MGPILNGHGVVGVL